MPRTQFIEYGGRQIVLLDFTNIVEPEAALVAIVEAREFIARQPPGSVLTLTHVTGSHFDSGVLKAIREMVEQNRPYVRAGAVVGLAGLTKVVFNTLLHLTGRNIKAFEDLGAAKEYLIGQ